MPKRLIILGHWRNARFLSPVCGSERRTMGTYYMQVPPEKYSTDLKWVTIKSQRKVYTLEREPNLRILSEYK